MKLNTEAVKKAIENIIDTLEQKRPTQEEWSVSIEKLKNFDVYLELYKNCEYQQAFASLHYHLNELFKNMNDCHEREGEYKNYFNANKSRELLELLDYTEKLEGLHQKLQVPFTVAPPYKGNFEYVKIFLKERNGSTIPEDYKSLKIIEFEPIFHIQNSLHVPPPDDLSIDNQAKDCLTKAAKKIEEADYDGAITNCMSAIEVTLKGLYKQKTGNELKGKFQLLWNNFSEEFQLSSKTSDKSDNCLVEILDSIHNIIKNIAVLRNILSDAHGTKKQKKVEKHHAVFVKNLSMTMIDFLLGTIKHQENLRSKS